MRLRRGRRPQKPPPLLNPGALPPGPASCKPSSPAGRRAGCDSFPARQRPANHGPRHPIPEREARHARSVARSARRGLRRHRHQPALRVAECFTASTASRPRPTTCSGVLSLIFWSLIVVISIKYLVFVMRADNRGEGGILALLALVPHEAREAAPGAALGAGGARPVRRGAALRRRHDHAGHLGALGASRAWRWPRPRSSPS